MSEPTTAAGREHVEAWRDVADMTEATVAIEAEARAQAEEAFATPVAIIEERARADLARRIEARVGEGPWVYVEHWNEGDPDIPAMTVSQVLAVIREEAAR